MINIKLNIFKTVVIYRFMKSFERYRVFWISNNAKKKIYCRVILCDEHASERRELCALSAALRSPQPRRVKLRPQARHHVSVTFITWTYQMTRYHNRGYYFTKTSSYNNIIYNIYLLNKTAVFCSFLPFKLNIFLLDYRYLTESVVKTKIRSKPGKL